MKCTQTSRGEPLQESVVNQHKSEGKGNWLVSPPLPTYSTAKTGSTPSNLEHELDPRATKEATPRQMRPFLVASRDTRYPRHCFPWILSALHSMPTRGSPSLLRKLPRIALRRPLLGAPALTAPSRRVQERSRIDNGYQLLVSLPHLLPWFRKTTRATFPLHLSVLTLVTSWLVSLPHLLPPI